MSEADRLFIEVKLDQNYKVLPFTIGVLEALHLGVMVPESSDTRENLRSLYERNINVITMALQQDNPAVTADTVRKLRVGDVKVIREAVDEILIFAGIFKRPDATQPQETASGEARAAASTGDS